MQATETGHWLIYTLVGINIGVLTTLGMAATAEDSELDTNPRAIPYTGVLTIDGGPYDGDADLLFTVTDDGDCTFVESHEAVTTRGGRFSVNIGAVEGDVPACVFDAESVFIELAVRESGDEQPHRALAGRQKLNPVPFAYWAAEGSDLKVDGTLNVTDNAIINGALAAGSASLGGGSLQIQGGDITTDSGNINTGGGDITTSGGGLALGGGDISGVGTLSGHEGAAVGVSSNLQVAQGRTTFLQNTTDQDLGTHGALVVGDVGDINLAIDGNEVLARDNGANSTLFIQREGGDTQFDGDIDIGDGKDLTVNEISSLDNINPGGQAFSTGGNLTVGGQLEIGLDIVECDPGDGNGSEPCFCPEGSIAIGGGAEGGGSTLVRGSQPDGDNPRAWRLACVDYNRTSNTSFNPQHTACDAIFAICARIEDETP